MVESENAKGKRKKVPIWRLATDAFGAVVGNLGTFAALAFIPMVLNYLLSVAVFALAGNSLMNPAQFGPSNILWWLATFPSTLILAVFVVSWHRFVLLGRRDSAALAQFRLGPREVKFFLYVVLLSSPTYLTPLLIGEMTSNPDGHLMLGLLVPVVALVSIFLWLRLSFVLPSVAVDAKGGLGAAWHATWGVSWRMFWAMLLVMIPWVIIIGGVMLAVGFEEYNRIVISGESFYLIAIVQTILGLIAYAMVISVLSLAFQRHTGWSPDSEPGVSAHTA